MGIGRWRAAEQEGSGHCSLPCEPIHGSGSTRERLACSPIDEPLVREARAKRLEVKATPLAP